MIIFSNIQPQIFSFALFKCRSEFRKNRSSKNDCCRQVIFKIKSLSPFKEGLHWQSELYACKEKPAYFYDNRYKFIVDFEYYIRIIQQKGMPVYIDEVLLNIGFHDEQVTTYTKYNPEVQIPENIIFLNDQKKDILKNIVVFDYYWRLMRNLKIDSEKKLLSYLNDIKPKQQIISMIQFQRRIPTSLLKIGFVSKFFMFICYCKITAKGSSN